MNIYIKDLVVSKRKFHDIFISVYDPRASTSQGVPGSTAGPSPASGTSGGGGGAGSVGGSGGGGGAGCSAVGGGGGGVTPSFVFLQLYHNMSTYPITPPVPGQYSPSVILCIYNFGS